MQMSGNVVVNRDFDDVGVVMQIRAQKLGVIQRLLASHLCKFTARSRTDSRPRGQLLAPNLGLLRVRSHQ